MKTIGNTYGFSKLGHEFCYMFRWTSIFGVSRKRLWSYQRLILFRFWRVWVSSRVVVRIRGVGSILIGNIYILGWLAWSSSSGQLRTAWRRTTARWAIVDCGLGWRLLWYVAVVCCCRLFVYHLERMKMYECFYLVLSMYDCFKPKPKTAPRTSVFTFIRINVWN